MPRSWVFAQFTRVDPNSKVETIFLLLRYWGLHHNWDMQNAFVFDVGMESKHIYEGERSTNVMFFCWSKWKYYFLSEMFVLPIDNSTCSTTHVVSG